MEEESYELVSKNMLKNLREENKALKKEVSIVKQNLSEENTFKKYFDDIVGVFREESQKEREIFFNFLDEIKQINEKTFQKVIDKNREDINPILELIKQIEEMANHIEKNSNKDSEKTLNEILKVISSKNKQDFSSENKNNFKKIESKLDEIDDFLKKLKLMLSKVKKIE